MSASHKSEVHKQDKVPELPSLSPPIWLILALLLGRSSDWNYPGNLGKQIWSERVVGETRSSVEHPCQLPGQLSCLSVITRLWASSLILTLMA